LFLKLDFSKAYDKVDLQFLFQAMKVVGFPDSFTNMTRLLFHDAAAQVCVNGQVTEPFSIQQGVRQGCPLAPYLFLIVGEILNYSIKREVRLGRIRGIELPGAFEPQTIAQYADDTSLSIRGEEVHVQAAADTLQHFSRASGLIINESKSAAYFWAPQVNTCPLWTHRFRWQWAETHDVSKLLGAPFGLSLSTQDAD
jgi:hypothetical protein